MYEIKRDGSQWVVVTKSRGIVQYRNSKKQFCLDWIADNSN